LKANIRKSLIRSYIITNSQPTTTPDIESAMGAIEVRRNASAPDLKAGPLELAELLPPLVVPTIEID
jgi:hypothetical protein